jgi:anti-anti-sigma factor
MNPLSITIRKKTNPAGASETLVQLAGNLDNAGAARLAEELQPTLHAGTDQIVLEIAGLRHLNAEGVRSIARLATLQEQAGGQFSLINLSGQPEESRYAAREIEGGVTVLQLAGNLDLRGTQSVEHDVLKLCEGYRPRLLLDLSAADMIVSLGIRMLLQAIKTANAHGGRVLLLNPSPGVSSALEFSGLAQFIARGKESEVAAGMAS